jgi:hypothetical protein
MILLIYSVCTVVICKNFNKWRHDDEQPIYLALNIIFEMYHTVLEMLTK